MATRNISSSDQLIEDLASKIRDDILRGKSMEHAESHLLAEEVIGAAEAVIGAAIHMSNPTPARMNRIRREFGIL